MDNGGEVNYCVGVGSSDSQSGSVCEVNNMIQSINLIFHITKKPRTNEKWNKPMYFSFY